MKKFITRHPYAITSAIFLALLFVGFHYMNWRKDDYMFMLLLYFIVTLSVRLDDISRQIGSTQEKSSESDVTVLSTLQQIQLALQETNQRLKKIQTRLDQDTDI